MMLSLSKMVETMTGIIQIDQAIDINRQKNSKIFYVFINADLSKTQKKLNRQSRKNHQRSKRN